LRVPGIIFAPGLFREAGKIEGMRSLLDIVPSVCDLIGLPLKEGRFIGQSLFRPVEEDRVLFYSGWSRQQVVGMRKGETKFLIWPQQRDYQVYDNSKDAEDKVDLYKTRPEVKVQTAQALKEITRWGDVVNGQYAEWRRNAEEAPELVQPSHFVNNAGIRFGEVLFLYGYEFFTTIVQQGRSVWIRAGRRGEAKIKRPLEIVLIFKHQKHKGLEKSAKISTRVPLEKLEPGQYTTAEHFLFVPEVWPSGEIDVFLGVLGRKFGKHLAIKAMGHMIVGPDNLALLSEIQVRPEEETQQWWIDETGEGNINPGLIINPCAVIEGETKKYRLGAFPRPPEGDFKDQVDVLRSFGHIR